MTATKKYRARAPDERRARAGRVGESTFVADKTASTCSVSPTRDQAGDQAAVELMFRPGRLGDRVNVKGKPRRFGPHRGPPAQLEKGYVRLAAGQESISRRPQVEEGDSRCHS